MKLRSALFSLGISLLTRGRNQAATGSDIFQLIVDNPGTVVVGEAFTVQWGSIGENTFDIGLFNNSACEGEHVHDLCSEDDGCSDSDGSFNAIVPTSLGEGTCTYKACSGTRSKY